MPTIPQKDANLILRQSTKFPQQGDQCNGSCAFYFCCRNSKDFAECRGFLMLNGESEKLLKRGLTEHDLEYIENAHSIIQRSIDNGQHEQANVILRDIGQLRKKSYQHKTKKALWQCSKPRTQATQQPRQNQKKNAQVRDFQRCSPQVAKAKIQK